MSLKDLGRVIPKDFQKKIYQKRTRVIFSIDKSMRSSSNVSYWSQGERDIEEAINICPIRQKYRAKSSKRDHLDSTGKIIPLEKSTYRFLLSREKTIILDHYARFELALLSDNIAKQSCAHQNFFL